MRIHSYYSNVPELNAVDELRLSALWRERWQAAHWEPKILTEWDAQQHPLYPKLIEAVKNRPTVNAQAYEVACFARWLALAMAGGGFMADLDCIPYPKEFGVGMPYFTGAQLAHLHIFQQKGLCPSLVFAMADTCEQLVEHFMEGKLGRRDQGGREHWSDQYVIEDLALAKADWIESHDMVRCYSDEGWETATVVHFANSYMKDHQPRWKHIPILRK